MITKGFQNLFHTTSSCSLKRKNKVILRQVQEAFLIRSRSKLKQMADLSSLICLHFSPVVGGKKEHTTTFPIVFLQVHRAHITPTHGLVRAYSAHLSQDATSVSAHLNLPTFRFCAAAYKGLFVQRCARGMDSLSLPLSVAVITGPQRIFTTRLLLQKRVRQTGSKGLLNDSTAESVPFSFSSCMFQFIIHPVLLK